MAVSVLLPSACCFNGCAQHGTLQVLMDHGGRFPQKGLTIYLFCNPGNRAQRAISRGSYDWKVEHSELENLQVQCDLLCSLISPCSVSCDRAIKEDKILISVLNAWLKTSRSDMSSSESDLSLNRKSLISVKHQPFAEEFKLCWKCFAEGRELYPRTEKLIS